MIQLDTIFQKFKLCFIYDPMRRKFDESADSYRVISTHQDKSHMKAPY